MNEREQKLAKVFIKDKKLNENSLQKMKDPTLAEEWAKAIAHFIFRNGPVEGIHSKGHLTDADMKTINKYMTNQLTGLILSMQKGEWYLLDNMSVFYRMFGKQWDIADLTEFNNEKQLIIEKIAEIIDKESINNSSNEMEEDSRYIDIEYSSSFDDETGVIQSYATINNFCFYTDSHEKVGSSTFSLYNFGLYESWLDVMDVADHYSGDECLLIAALQDLIDEEWLDGKGILLHSLKVEDRFQQKGIGTETMEKLLSYWTVLGADFVILQAASPIKDQIDVNRGKYIERLVSFYESLGFEELDTDNNTQGPIMIMYLQ
jgi:GNAT superfamily N-acetyltransferase